MAKNGNANNQNTGASSQTASGNTNNQTTSGTTQQQPQTTVNQQISNPKYIVTIGFEVNHIATAFINDTQDLSVDYGHAFFYITKDDLVTVFFSFGPNGAAVPGKITDEYNGPRPGNTSYAVTEISKLFRLEINETQADNVLKAATDFTSKVAAGTEKYNASNNDTCAETARDILKEGGVKTPSGSGHITGIGLDFITKTFTFVNPYMWHKNCLAEYGAEITYYGPRGMAGIDADGYTIASGGWTVAAGSNDPLFGSPDITTIHADVQSKK